MSETFYKGDFDQIVEQLNFIKAVPGDVMVCTYSGGYVALVDKTGGATGKWGKVQTADSLEDVGKKLGSTPYSNALLSSFTGGYVFSIWS